jgi:hypothetical protein
MEHPALVWNPPVLFRAVGSQWFRGGNKHHVTYVVFAFVY